MALHTVHQSYQWTILGWYIACNETHIRSILCLVLCLRGIDNKKIHYAIRDKKIFSSQERFTSCLKLEHYSNVTLRFVTRIFLGYYQYLYLSLRESGTVRVFTW